MTENTEKRGMRFLKYGQLAHPSAVRINGAPTVGRFPGKRDLPLEIDGQNFVLSVSEKNPQWANLIAAFGTPGESWVGCTVQVSDGAVLKQVNVTPIADATGAAVVY